MIYRKLLLDNIEAERNGTNFKYDNNDRLVLCEMLREINRLHNTDFKYLAELDAFHIKGSGNIVKKYINDFASESVKGFLVPQMVLDQIKDCDSIVLELYQNFRNSNMYYPLPGISNAHIYVRYDNAFRKLKPKRLKQDMLELAYQHRDIYYLPLTMRMMASWKIPEMKVLLISLLSGENITAESMGLIEETKEVIDARRNLLFTGIAGLKYYPSDDVVSAIARFKNDDDKDIREAANKTLKVLLKKA